jgi:hypothetical protein
VSGSEESTSVADTYGKARVDGQDPDATSWRKNAVAAERSAEDAVDFAYAAIEEAEYAVLVRNLPAPMQMKPRLSALSAPRSHVSP